MILRLAILTVLLLPAPSAQAQDLLFFRSPSDNIHCVISPYEGATCVLGVDHISYPRRPFDCDPDWDWGSTYMAPQFGPGMPVCSNEGVRVDGSPVLHYGSTITHAGITCRSERTGMTCVNAQGHGFTVARARQRVF
jgi:hypothetical protein